MRSGRNDNAAADEFRTQPLWGLGQRLFLLHDGRTSDLTVAISVGMVGREVLLDLDYIEDSNAEVDMNVVMTGSNQLVEVQATAEGHAFSLDDLNRLVEASRPGIQTLLALQQSILKLNLPSH